MCVAAIAPARDITSRLVRFLNNHPGARVSFAKDLRRRLTLVTKKIMPDLDASLREEVVQQAFVALLDNPRRYNPARGTAISFLFQIVREAARTVRAAYAPPATRKRERSDAPTPAAPVALHDLTDNEMMQFAPARYGSAESVEARCDLLVLVPRLPGQLLIAFTLIAEGDTKVLAAQMAGITRFQFDTRMTRFKRDMRLAA